MRTYLLVSTIVFDLLAMLHLVRFVLGWPLIIADVAVPGWVSVVAFLGLSSLAIWSIRLLIREQRHAAA